MCKHSLIRAWLSLALAGAGTTGLAADPFVPAGSKATLTVDYVFESAATQGGSTPAKPHTWRVRRNASISNILVAQAGLPLASLQNNDAAALGKQDELSARAAAAAMTPRFQAWQASAQTGDYEVNETHQITELGSPCRQMTQCTYQLLRKGAGALPLPSEAKNDLRQIADFAGVRFDAAKKTIRFKLALPGELPTTQTITGTADGGQTAQRLVRMHVWAHDSANVERLITVAQQADWRRLAGEQKVHIPGNFGEAGRADGALALGCAMKRCAGPRCGGKIGASPLTPKSAT
jgi:hypothetical protein